SRGDHEGRQVPQERVELIMQSVLAHQRSAALAGAPHRRAPLGRWTLNGAVLNNKNFVGGFILSAEVGIAATLIGLALAVPASLAIARRRFAGRGAVNTLLLMPLVVPG